MYVYFKRTFVVSDMLTFVGVVTTNDHIKYGYRIYQLANKNQDLTDDTIIEDCEPNTGEPLHAEKLMMEMIDYYRYR